MSDPRGRGPSCISQFVQELSEDSNENFIGVISLGHDL